jgi:hypothetical protein
MEYNYQRVNAATKSGGVLSQIIYGFTLAVIVYIVLLFIEVVYKYVNRLSLNKTILLENTYTTDTKTVVLPQNPNGNESKIVHLSRDERSGIEFSYAFYLFVNPASFRQEYGLLHIFHKGYSSQFPLLAPGVYMRSDTNTLRVYMNTFKTWNNYVEVENMPVNKWVHVVVSCKNNGLEVFINGNLKKRLSFDGFAPYQNYQDIVCFSQRRITLPQSKVPSVDEHGFDVFGTIKGLVSRLHYYSYALSYSEIQQLLQEGPSSKMDGSLDTSNIPPYLDDTWWTQGN